MPAPEGSTRKPVSRTQLLMVGGIVGIVLFTGFLSFTLLGGVDLYSEKGPVGLFQQTSSTRLSVPPPLPAPAGCEPLVIRVVPGDIEGLGLIESYPLAYFDFRGDGFSEAVEALNPGSALLARDLNRNGNIDDGGELFCKGAPLPNGKPASTAQDLLVALDDNRDGKLTKLDGAWPHLRAFQLGIPSQAKNPGTPLLATGVDSIYQVNPGGCRFGREW